MSGASLPPPLRRAAENLFGDRLDLAERYAQLLATEGVVRGLIGPREAARLWDRHLLNSAVVAELIPLEAFVVDVGSGAGLPGIVLAVARPDLTVVLLEPLARRSTFLNEAASILGLGSRVTVVRGRAEEFTGGFHVAASRPGAASVGQGRAMQGSPAAGPDRPRLGDVVTARAVAPLDRLAAWCLPLATVGGRLLAFKGASAADEVAAHARAVARLGGSVPVVRQCGVGLLDPPATIVEIARQRAVAPSPTRSPRGAARRRRSARRR